MFLLIAPGEAHAGNAGYSFLEGELEVTQADQKAFDAASLAGSTLVLPGAAKDRVYDPFMYGG